MTDRADLLARLTADTEPAHSADRDTREPDPGDEMIGITLAGIDALKPWARELELERDGKQEEESC